VYDVIIVGAGHNGLTAACYLARAGKKVLILERRHVVGGAAVTEEIAPGFRASSASYVVSLLRDEIVRDLDLKRHGFETVPMEGSLCVLGDGRHLTLIGDTEADMAEVARHSNRDYRAKLRFDADLAAVADVLRRQMLREPPELGAGWTSLLSALRLGNDVRGLDVDRRHRLMQLLTTPAGDLLDRWFDSEIIKVKYASSVVAGTCVSLRQPGSAINMLHLSIGEINGVKGAWALARGGMGAITQAMAATARERGVTIRTESEVERILVEDDKVAGVRLANGEELRSPIVAANTDPKRTFLGLVGADNLDPDFADDIAHWRQNSGSFRMNLALRSLPTFSLPEPAPPHDPTRCHITFAPGYATFDETYELAGRGELPTEAVISAHFPTVFDATLAPDGGHIMSMLCQHYPFELSQGRDWDDWREPVADQIIAQLARHMPNLADLVVARQIHSPADLERVFGLTGGDVYHGKLEPDQLFSMRPHPRAARYRTPIAGLYLCGAGAHPGGGVSGAPGHNAAKRILQDMR
jgi:phytoene dehydrogenase-like protein